MTLAYPIVTVQVRTINGLEEEGLRVGTLFNTGNLLFRARVVGSTMQSRTRGWAKAMEVNGTRWYLVWRANTEKVRGLVIQPMDSTYCYAALPMEA